MMFGQILAYSATKDEINGLWFPSYGPETRGGTANCSVIVSKEKINSPVFKNADHLIAFNSPSLEKFRGHVAEGGLILYNSSLILDNSLILHLPPLGIVKLKIVPPPGLSSTQTLPPNASTSSFTMVKPSPVPRGRAPSAPPGFT